MTALSQKTKDALIKLMLARKRIPDWSGAANTEIRHNEVGDIKCSGKLMLWRMNSDKKEALFSCEGCGKNETIYFNAFLKGT